MKYLPLLLITSIIIIAGCTSPSSKYSKDSIDGLSNCLSEKDVKEYGAFWCPNCAKQEKMFGESHSILKQKGVYIECDPRCIKDDKGNLPTACRGIEGQAELCISKGIDKYPTWTFPDDTRLVGVQELDFLAQKAGCALEVK